MTRPLKRTLNRPPAQPRAAVTATNRRRPRALTIGLAVAALGAGGRSAYSTQPASQSSSAIAGEVPGAAAEPFVLLLAEATAFRQDEHALPVPPGTDSRYAKRWPNVSSRRFAEEAESLEAFAERLSRFDPQGLRPAERIDAEILGRQLRDRLAELRFRVFEIPIGSREGFHFEMATLAETSRFDTIKQYDDYIAKLQSFGEHSKQQITHLRAGLRAGRTLPRAVLEGYDLPVAEQIVDHPEESPLFGPLQDLPAYFPEAEKDRLRRDGLAALAESVLPAFRELLVFLRLEYIPGARRTLGVSDLPEGEAFYQHRIRMFTTLALTPQQVHDMGTHEVERLRREMLATIERAGFAGDFDEFVEFLRSDPRFVAPNEEQYLQAVALGAKRMDGELPRLFALLPRTPYGIRGMPPQLAPRLSAGYYDHGEADGSQAGFININTSDLPTRPLYVAPVLAFHEGVPGHHLQIMLARENEELSEFRRELGITVFVEGWGLYAESLGREAGLLDDPYADFGRLTYEIWRAVRLVVDSGVHALGWTRQQAIDYMMKNTGFQEGPATAEVDRHITEAGQGLAYTPGLIAIRELRRRAEQSLGERFDLRLFHDAVLQNGALPLDLLQAEVGMWIEQQHNSAQ